MGKIAFRSRMGVVLLICLVLLSALILLSLAVGTRSLTLEEILTGLAGQRKTVASIIIWRMRMPRTVLAVVVGAALAVAGVVMQGLTRNPLAEPGILGVNAGASLAVVLSRSWARSLGATPACWCGSAPSSPSASCLPWPPG